VDELTGGGEEEEEEEEEEAEAGGTTDLEFELEARVASQAGRVVGRHDGARVWVWVCGVEERRREGRRVVGGGGQGDVE